jgi:phosphatidyl-myo-inositol alpha-mannosyltransferase
MGEPRELIVGTAGRCAGVDGSLAGSSRALRVGLVCPYSWDVPGGVQAHIRGLALALREAGHEVSVLAPADSERLPAEPDWVVSAGRAVPVPFNGSVARLTFGPVAMTRVRRWLNEGAFDILHVHEPTVPSLSLLACWAAGGPIVGTFHMANERSRTMAAARPMLQPALEKIVARIAVSEPARRMLVEHLGGDAILIPNGVSVARFAGAAPLPGWPGDAGALGFLGRFSEPRKGFAVLIEAMEALVATRPGLRLLVAGPGDQEAALAAMPPAVRGRVTMLGVVTDSDKARMLRSVDLYVAPNTGGESFGVVLTEAMAAGSAVIASDLDGFRRVLDDGSCATLVPPGDATALADGIAALLDDPARRRAGAAVAARSVSRFDWARVMADVVAVYETVGGGAGAKKAGAKKAGAKKSEGAGVAVRGDDVAAIAGQRGGRFARRPGLSHN